MPDEETYENYCERVRREEYAKWLNFSPIYNNVVYVYFTSKSKGRRNGKQRLRRNWKEIELIKYRDRPYTLAHRFPFDVYATEVLGDIEDAVGKFRELIPILARRN